MSLFSSARLPLPLSPKGCIAAAVDVWNCKEDQCKLPYYQGQGFAVFEKLHDIAAVNNVRLAIELQELLQGGYLMLCVG